MMAGERPIGEDDLHAYVDGVLDATRRRIVEQYLADHHQAAARIAGWQRANEVLRKAVAWKAEEPVPAALSVARLMEARMSRRWEPWRMAAGIVIALGVGAGAGWVARGPGMPTGVASVGAQAAMAHRVFADHADVVEFSGGERARLVRWATEQFGRPVTPPDLSKSGYRLVGGRLLAMEQGPACMFLYEDAKGNPITLFERPMLKRDMNAPMQPVRVKSTSGFAWARDGMGFGLVATNPMATIHRLADRVRTEIDSGT